MSTFHSTINIYNNSGKTLTLDRGHSSGINGDWPGTLSPEPGENHYKFNQGFNFQIKFTARYIVQDPTIAPSEYVDIYYYADGVQTFSQHVTGSPSNVLADSTIEVSGNYSPTITLAGGS